MSDDVRLLHVQRLEEEQQILGLGAFIGESRRFSESAGVVADDLVPGLEGGDLIVPHADVVGPAVNEDDRRTFARHVVVDVGVTNIERARLRPTRPTDREQNRNQEQFHRSHDLYLSGYWISATLGG